MSQEEFIVFIVDDDPATVAMLKEHFSKQFHGISLVVFESAEKAIEQLMQKPHLIILDHLFNSKEQNAMNGLSALTQIKKQVRTVPVVVLSAQNDPDIAARFIKAGAYDYIVKNNDAFPKLDQVIRHFSSHMMIDNKAISKKLYSILLIVALLIIILFILFNYGP